MKKFIPHIIQVISLIILIIMFIFLIKINLIPNKYLIIISIILLIINIIIFILNTRKKLIFKIIGCVLASIMMIISIFGIFYLNKTDNFFNKTISNNRVETTTYYIIAKKDTSIKKEDLNNQTLYYYNNIDIKVIDKYLKDTYSFKYQKEDDLKQLFLDIKNGSKDIFLIDKSTYTLALEIDDELSNSDYVILYKFDISKTIKIKKKDTKDKFNLLIVGADFANLNDLNLLVTVNTKKNKILVTTIPRAYYIEVYGDGRKDTLSFMAPYGIEVSKKSIENYFNINIDYYIKINTHTLVNLVDEIGGITYCSDQAYYTTHSLVLDTYIDNKGKFYVKKGCQELNGIQTLTVARERKAFHDADRTRQKNCVKIMQAIIDKMISTNTLTNYENVLNSLADLYETDIPRDEISLISKYYIEHPNSLKLDMQSVDGSETMDYVHLTNLKDYVIVPEESTVKIAVNNINEVLK